MILNILLIIILLIVFYRIVFKTNAESYQNPFIYQTPFIDNNKLAYTPLPYIPSLDTPSLAAIDNVNGYVTKNNQLIIAYADDSNFIIDDPSVKNAKILSFVDKQLINKSNNNCLDLDSKKQNTLFKGCNSNTQLWSLINDRIVNKSTSKCLAYGSNDRIVLQSINANSLEQQWIPDTLGRIHSLKDYNKCLDIEGTFSVKPCSQSPSQQWLNN
jgi:hypothetical protein